MSPSWPSRSTQATLFAPVPNSQPRTFATSSAAYWSALVAIEPAAVVASGQMMLRSVAVTPLVAGATSATNSASSGAGMVPRSTEA
jgi:hypothetical protein